MRSLHITLALLLGVIISTPTFGQYFNFGKNRVQYEDFEWRFIQTTHFDVYYYGEKNYELAEFAAQSVESAYEQLMEDFNHEIVDRIELIIYDSHNDFSQTNVVNLPISAEGIGGVTDKLKNRMTVPFDGDYNDFRRTIHHELVHAVFNDMFYGGTITSIVSNNIQLVFPLWFEEGLAEYTALGWDTNTDMFIRDAVINNYLPPIQYLSGYYAYRGGQSLWNFIAEEYGREKIAEILRRIKTSRNIEFAFAQSLGLTIPELSDRWQDALKRRYFPEVAERESADNIATLMTPRGAYGTYNTSPAISPQGDKIAFITNKRGYFDVIAISTLDGRRLKTLIRGEDNPEFEELNILNPGLTWSPDGRKVAMSTKSRGRDDIAIIDYVTGEVEKIKFSQLDAIGSVSWSPDGTKLAFAGNIGPYQDIFVYELGEQRLTNLTNDFFSDVEPVWGMDSQSIFFSSNRGDKLETGRYSTTYNMLSDLNMYQHDIYRLEVGAGQLERLTSTTDASERMPRATQTGRLVFISDKNGIQNIYDYDLKNRIATPLTDLQAGASQLSISADGSRIAFNSINQGYLDIFLFKSPFNRAKSGELTLNYWAKRRQAEPDIQRVPALAYAVNIATVDHDHDHEEEKVSDIPVPVVEQEKEEDSYEETGVIDFRNYVFGEEVLQDTTIILEDVQKFSIDDNLTEDGRYQPRDYRLKFTTDIAYAPSVGVNSFGTFATTQFIISDLLGDHQIALGTNLVFDLKNSNYSLQYGYLKNRMNYFVTYFHTALAYQTFAGDLVRFRNFGGGVSMQYPLDKFRRVDFGVNFLGITQDFSNVFLPTDNTIDQPVGQGLNLTSDAESNNAVFLNPTLTYTSDRTLPGFLSPRGGSRFSVSLSGSPGVGAGSPQFISLLADGRKYLNLGYNYTIALRGSAGSSFGPNSQTYFMGGRLGWINQQWSQNNLPIDRLADTFFTVPALPLRGYEFNSIYGDQFALINTEFRFPLFAALVPGAIPLFPLYNITGVAFLDVGTAFGQDIVYDFVDENGNSIVNDERLDFEVGKNRTGFAQTQNGLLPVDYIEGDILIGGGFGLRTILFGLPFRWDVGWPYDRSGFAGPPIHYFSIGVDF
ncbi:MAG: hypothetical protein AAFW89_05665 [Bacteroidota bacterium]